MATFFQYLWIRATQHSGGIWIHSSSQTLQLRHFSSMSAVHNSLLFVCHQLKDIVRVYPCEFDKDQVTFFCQINEEIRLIPQCNRLQWKLCCVENTAAHKSQSLNASFCRRDQWDVLLTFDVACLSLACSTSSLYEEPLLLWIFSFSICSTRAFCLAFSRFNCYIKKGKINIIKVSLTNILDHKNSRSIVFSSFCCIYHIKAIFIWIYWSNVKPADVWHENDEK